MSVLSLSYWESEVYWRQNNKHLAELAHKMAENSWYEEITPLSPYVYCIYFGRHRVVFRLQLLQTASNLDENWNISKEPRCTLIKEKLGKSPEGFHLRVPKHVFSVFNAMGPFGHLSCTDFDHFWNNKTWIVFCMRTLLKVFRISVQGVSTSQRQPKMGTVKHGVCEVHLKLHNFGQWESFLGLVDIPRMYPLYVSFGGGCRIWAL